MVEVRVWIALELLESGVSLECVTESHQALHLPTITDAVSSEAAVGGVGLSVATDDFWAKFWACTPDGDESGVDCEHVADLQNTLSGEGATTILVNATDCIVVQTAIG